ncbi:MAG: putative DNA modification/repair radical SAM protein [Aminipila sp.]
MDGMIMNKLKVLADSAKYDVSCSTSGVNRKNSGKLGNASAAGICHSWSADGRCISLLKILFTNKCVYDCSYCINRRTSDVERASLEPRELADLTMEFYRRNYIEGLFLSSAVEVSPDHTAERILQALSILRYEYGFNGYIHAKIIPGVSKELVHSIGLLADRLSVNIELPTEDSLKKFAPQKKSSSIFTPMKQITTTLIEQKTLKGPGTMFKGQNLTIGDGSLTDIGTLNNTSLMRAPRYKYNSKFAPAGQTTQMIIGAGGETDKQIVKTSEGLYHSFKMKRVYFSAYIPISDSPLLPSVFTAPPLKREHRLYQADWLLRFYGFTADEMFTAEEPNLDLDLDPKITWALRNINLFPIEINKASMEELLRIPGIGTTSAFRIIRQRRISAVKYDDLKKIGVVLKRAKYFLTCSGKYYGDKELDPSYIKNMILEPTVIKSRLLPINDTVQVSMFTPEIEQLSVSPITKGLPNNSKEGLIMS